MLRFLLVLLLVVVVVATGAGFMSGLMRGTGGDASPAARLLSSNLRRPDVLYHVEDLQARPAVAAAIARMKAANICDLFYRVETHKMDSHTKRARLCGTPRGDRHVEQRGEYDYEDSELHPDIPPPPRFAVFTDTDGATYLFSDGKHGKQTLEEAEKVIVTVIDNAIARLPERMAARAESEAKTAADRAAADAARKRAQESFK